MSKIINLTPFNSTKNLNVGRKVALGLQWTGITTGLILLVSPKLSIAAEFFTPPPLPRLSDPKAYLPPLIEPFRLELNLTRRRVTLFRGNSPVKSYAVAVGKPGWETPVGKYQIKTMYRNPVWVNPFTGEVIPGGSRDNPLGTKWMGFWTDGKNQIGFHGTFNRSSVGQPASHGCVRMLEEDISDLFKTVPLGTPVNVFWDKS